VVDSYRGWWLGALVVVGGLAFSSAARAADGWGDSGTDQPSSAEKAPAPAPASSREGDAHTDRVILMPTAETQPKGSFFVSSYELVFLQFGYGITDDLQFSALMLPPILADQPFFISPTLKLNVARGEAGNVALLGGVDVVVSGDDDDAAGMLGRFGAVGQLCIQRGCRSSLSLNALAWSGLAGTEGTVLVTSAGGVFRVTDTIALLLEPTLAIPLGDALSEGEAAGALSYGMRFSGASFGIDLTFVRPFTGDTVEFALGLPFVVATYRTN
jgi:hypothetical protein